MFLRKPRGDFYQPSETALTLFYSNEKKRKQEEAMKALRAGMNPDPAFVPEISCARHSEIADEKARRSVIAMHLDALGMVMTSEGLSLKTKLRPGQV